VEEADERDPTMDGNTGTRELGRGRRALRKIRQGKSLGKKLAMRTMGWKTEV